MTNPFLPLYRYFRNNRPAFFIFVLVITGLAFVFASKIRFEEDISRVTGGNDTANLFEYVSSHQNFAEKLIITFSSHNEDETELLTEAARTFTDSLKNEFDTSYIKDIQGDVQDSVISAYIDFFYENAPVYLDENDYRIIENRLQKDSLEKIVAGNYHTLVTPAGFALKKSIARDPFGITFLAMKKMQSLQAGEQFDLIDGFIFTKDHKNLMIFITPSNPPSETSKNGKLVWKTEDLLQKIERNYPGINTSCFGAAAIAVSNATQLKQDIMLTLSVAVFLIILLIGWYFRSIRIPLLGFLPAVFGGALALAVLAVLKGSISAIALGIGSVILGLIVDYALYFINNLRKSNNIEKVITEMTPAILLCAITSAGAFMCLVFLKSAVLHDLGWFAALSVLGAAVFAIIILPQLLSEKKDPAPAKPNFIDRISSFPYDKKPFLTGFIFLCVVAGSVFIHKVDFENNMQKLNFTTPKLDSAQQKLDSISDYSLKSVYFVSIGKNEEEALRESEKTAAILNQLEENGLIKTYSGVNKLLFSDSLQKVKIERWKAFWTQEKKDNFQKNLTEILKKYGFKESAITSSFNLINNEYQNLNQKDKKNISKLLLKDFIRSDKNMVMITSIARTTGENRSKVHGEVQSQKNLVVFDRQQMTEKFISDVKEDFELLVRLSMIFVTLLLFFSFGRIEIAFLAAVPMYASWLITLGFMGITGLKFNIFNIILSSFIFGLGVDYSILMMRGLLYNYKYGDSDINSYKTAVFLSAATTIFGVGALFFAGHPALKSIALISVIGVASVVLVTFTLQPFLYNHLIGNRLKKHLYPVTFRVFIKTIITWTNIVIVALILAVTGLILTILPLPRKYKQNIFHRLFTSLSGIYIAITFPTNRKLINENNEDFSKPAIIISNHQSLIETPAFLRLHPKILILTNDWVWNSPLFGPVARLASFFNADHGLDAIMEKLRQKVSEGYSILIFPEAHRSEDGHIQRFHRGAFYLAEKLNLDILPVVVFGSGDFLAKNAFWGRPNPLVMKILKRVRPGDETYGKTYSERTRGFRKLFISEYSALKNEFASTHYYRKKLILNYVLKGPVLEWYIRVKMKLADNYERFEKFIPKSGKILDIGCGYGYISYMLMMTSAERDITGIDYDEEKIRIASNGFLKNERIRFIYEDITKYPITKHAAFLLSDVLHYLDKPAQQKLLKDCFENLETGGVVVIRDADASKTKNHKRSRFTEFMSTKVMKFNKTSSPDKILNFTSAEEIKNIAAEYGLNCEIVTEASVTSNVLMVIK